MNPECQKHAQTVSNRSHTSQKRCDTREIVTSRNHSLFTFRPKTRQYLSKLISWANAIDQPCLIIVRSEVWSASAAI